MQYIPPFDEFLLNYSIFLLFQNHPLHIKIAGLSYLHRICDKISSNSNTYCTQLLTKYVMNGSNNFIFNLTNVVASILEPAFETVEARDQVIKEWTRCVIISLKCVCGNQQLCIQILGNVWSYAGLLLTVSELYDISGEFPDYLNIIISNPSLYIPNFDKIKNKLFEVEALILKKSIDSIPPSGSHVEGSSSKVMNILMTPFFYPQQQFNPVPNPTREMWPFSYAENGYNIFKAVVNETENVKFINFLFQYLNSYQNRFFDPGYK
jgi:hypothetical protein